MTKSYIQFVVGEPARGSIATLKTTAFVLSTNLSENT
jgi:hypothetical protein